MSTFTTNEIIRPGFKANCLQQMKIILDVEAELAGNENFLALCIKEQIRLQTPAAKIISEIAEMAQDNFDAIAFLLGNKLTNEIMAQ